jgi:hypothetical protein
MSWTGTLLFDLLGCIKKIKEDVQTEQQIEKTS